MISKVRIAALVITPFAALIGWAVMAEMSPPTRCEWHNDIVIGGGHPAGLARVTTCYSLGLPVVETIRRY